MADIWFVVLAIGSFLVCWAYLIGLERLGAPKE
jgi:hypothetical protein